MTLDALSFLQTILPAQGWYVGFARRGEARRQESFDSQEKLLAWLQRNDADGFDCYHAIAAFHEPKAWNDRLQKYERRSHENVRAVRCLIADIDTQESKGNAPYVDRGCSWRAAEKFCKQTEIPAPLYVSSGGGIHCYWPLAFELDLEQFTRLGTALKRAAIAYGLEIDPARTADASSILRTPTTRHWKSGNTVTCQDEPVGPYTLEQFDSLKEFEDATSHSRRNRSQPAGLTTSIAGAAGAVYSDDPSNPGACTRGCAQLGQLQMDPGKHSEPTHYAAAGVYAFCTGGTEYYVGFLAPEWRDAGRVKIDQWLAHASGPATCAYFASINPQGCKGCPHKEKIATPLQLGRGYGSERTQHIPTAGQSRSTAQKTYVNGHAAQAFPQAQSEIVLPPLPPHFAWIDDRLVFYEEQHGERVNTIISDFPIFLSRINAGETAGAVSFTFQQFHPHDGWRECTVLAGRLFGPQGLSDLADNGARVRELKLFHRYCHDAASVWNAGQSMMTAYEQCGWKNDDTGFVVGDYLYSADYCGPVAVNEDLRVRSQWLCPSGSVEAWSAAANRILQPVGLAGQAVVLAGFASLFMRWQAPLEGGAVFSLVNRESGTGKSMLLATSATVWGQWPGLSIKSIDTNAAHGLMLAGLGNLPCYFDEFGEMATADTPERVRDFVMMVSNGADKLRAQQHGRGLQHAQKSFGLMLITASNKSVVDHLEVFNSETDAPSMRILELMIRLPDNHDYAVGEQLKAQLIANAGTAGDAFLTHLVQPHILEFARKALAQWTAEIYKVTRWPAKYRFWTRVLGAVAVAGALVQELGLIDCDPYEVVQYLIHQLDRPELIMAPVGPLPLPDLAALVGEYINQNMAGILTVTQAWRPGSPPQVPQRTPPGRLLMRYETATGRLYTPIRDFRQWLAGTGHVYADVSRGMVDAGMLVNAKRMLTMGAGTPIPSAPVACLEFDMQHPQLSQCAREITGEDHAVPGTTGSDGARRIPQRTPYRLHT